MSPPPLRCALFIALAVGCHSVVEYPGTGGGAGTWLNVTANLAGMPSECGNMTLLSSRPDRDALIAGVALRGLWQSANGATTWSPLGQGAGSAVITNRPSSIIYDPNHPATFWESGVYNGGGVYRTDDDGATFTQLGTVTHCDLVSVDFSDTARRTLLAGAHESGQRMFRSTDGGATWTDIGLRFPASAGNTSFPLVLDTQTSLVGTWGSTAAGIFRSSDGGNSWTRVFATSARSIPLVASDGAIYWMGEDGGIIKSSDRGISWTTVAGVLTWTSVGLIELPDGTFAALGGGYLVLSNDRGGTWQRRGAPLPYVPSGLAYSRFRKAFYIWHWDCLQSPDPVPADAIMSLPL
jgi:photosystem II stability/assembly factor-like uncharacterized protein